MEFTFDDRDREKDFEFIKFNKINVKIRNKISIKQQSKSFPYAQARL